MTSLPARLFRPRPAALALLLAMALIALAPARAVLAQSLFSPVVYVNDEPITNYQVNQKQRFLRFLGAGGEVTRALAIERLIEERLQFQEARRLGGRLNPDQVAAGIAEFAGRFDLTAEQLTQRMQQAGIDRETLVEFVTSGLLWRQLVQQIHGPQIRITNAQIDQALSVAGLQPVSEVLISELFLPADPQFAEAVQRVIPQIQRIRSETEFANAARQLSAAPSGPSGGRVDRWLSLSALPPELGAVLQGAAVGSVIGPVEVPGAYAFFQLRARRESRGVGPDQTELDYRRVRVPGGMSPENRELSARLRDTVDGCAGFPGTVLELWPTLPETAVETVTQTQTQVPAATRSELERLNPGQISAGMVENGDLVVLMLCARRVASAIAPSREEVQMQLLNRALEGHGMVYLQRLRADAEIRYP